MILYFIFLLAFYLFYRDMENNTNEHNLKRLCIYLAIYFLIIMKG